MAVRFLEETVQRFLSEQDINAFQMEYGEVFDTIRRGQDTRYQDSLGWFHTLRYAGEAQLKAIMETADRVRTDGDAFVIVGVGGSNQAARAVIESLGSAGDMTVYYAGNTLSPYNLTSVLRELKDKSVYVNVIAKNFSTLEPGISFRMLRRFLTEKYGNEASRRVIVTGTPGSELEAISRREGYTFLEFPEDIGGRYSAFSSVGIFPMAVAGVDIDVYKRQDIDIVVAEAVYIFGNDGQQLSPVLLRLQHITVNDKQGGADKVDNVGPVSYTHLDVYKRQMLR